ncbi:hypothetical protein H6F42_19700 [Pseudanabaena sp. FACHB-1998]|uniref:hypothetical protein n=1 Tax=Pseudanabaena sp. FACHB-1998 TaxID=2692858 RepID=UPI0016810B53|nr:hypothetical protein [Pseudanabaena sp. FACHB-1998]MBD2179152.1 hypothetical protein [Pseudanabaena sp. FACHB-1998]
MQNLPQYTTYRSLLDQRQGQGFSEAEAIDILRQVLSQLTKLHALKQAHGAISLDTVAYDASRMYIVLLSGQGNNYPIYLAPEVAINREATPAGDIYALGVFTIALLTGLPPEKLKNARNEWDWEDHCNVSSRFIQILNITLFDSLDFRYVNAGQMLRSIQSILIKDDAELAIAENISELVLPDHNSTAINFAKPLPLPPSKLGSGESIANPQSTEKLDFSSNNRPEISELKAELPDSPTYRRTKFSTDSNQHISRSNAKGRKGFLLLLLLGIGIMGVGIIAIYFFNQTNNQTSSLNSLKNPLTNTEASNIKNQTVATVSEATRLENAQKAEEKLNRLIGSAKAKYESTGNLMEVKTILQEIPASSSLRPKVDLLIKQWQEDMKKNNEAIAKAEIAITNGSGQQAIDILKSISSTPYWQQRSKKILENAKQQLNRKMEAPLPIAPPSEYVPPLNPEPPVINPEVPEPLETPSYNAPSYSPPSYSAPPKEAPPPRAAN